MIVKHFCKTNMDTSLCNPLYWQKQANDNKIHFKMSVRLITVTFQVCFYGSLRDNMVTAHLLFCIILENPQVSISAKILSHCTCVGILCRLRRGCVRK